MPKLNFSVPHFQTKEDARHRLEHFAERLRNKFQDQVSDFQQTWSDDALDFTFKTFGMQVQGNITVNDADLAIACQLPLSAMIFKNKIQSEIEDQLGRLME